MARSGKRTSDLDDLLDEIFKADQPDFQVEKGKNSMDDIIIQYGGVDYKEPLFLEDEADAGVKKCTLREFLEKVKPQSLSPFERKVQKALKKIYDLNGKEPPLYKGFEKIDGKDLVINCLSRGTSKDEATAAYVSDFRSIEFRKLGSRKVQTEEDFVAALSHELKHAENDTKQYRKIIANVDNYAIQQLSFLDEAWAYLCDTKVCHALFPNSKRRLVAMYRDGLKNLPPDRLELAFIAEEVSRVSKSNDYRTNYERLYPVQDTDLGVDFVAIPESLKGNRGRLELTRVLHKCVSKEPSTPGAWVYSYLHRGQYDKALKLVKSNRNLMPLMKLFLSDRILEQNYDVAVTLVEKCPKLLSELRMPRLAVTGRVDLMERLYRLKQKHSSPKHAKSDNLITWIDFAHRIKKELSLEQQKLFLPVVQFLLAHMETPGAADSLARDQQQLKNNVFLAGLLNMKDEKGNYYCSETVRKEFLPSKAKRKGGKGPEAGSVRKSGRGGK